VFVTQFYPEAELRRYNDSGGVINDMRSVSPSDNDANDTPCPPGEAG
jgi:hypothetical protein